MVCSDKDFGGILPNTDPPLQCSSASFPWLDKLSQLANCRTANIVYPAIIRAQYFIFLPPILVGRTLIENWHYNI
jgi:hypothetical protein